MPLFKNIVNGIIQQGVYEIALDPFILCNNEKSLEREMNRGGVAGDISFLALSFLWIG